MSCDCMTFDLDWYDPLCLGGILRVDLTIPIVAFCSQFLVYVRSLPSFCISIPNIISVAGSLSHIIKLWVNLKSAILK